MFIKSFIRRTLRQPLGVSINVTMWCMWGTYCRPNVAFEKTWFFISVEKDRACPPFLITQPDTVSLGTRRLPIRSVSSSGKDKPWWHHYDIITWLRICDVPENNSELLCCSSPWTSAMAVVQRQCSDVQTRASVLGSVPGQETAGPGRVHVINFV